MTEIGDLSYSEDVFTNHNENLTIYCYEGSVAASYAIKYVYLQRTANTDTTQEGGKAEEPKSTDVNKEGAKEVTPKVDPDEDKTIVPSTLPNTGAGFRVIVAIVAVVTSLVFAYYKWFRLKDVK